MATRSYWKGFLRLSLVSMPVKAYSATSSSSQISLNQLHAECNSRIQYRKYCPIHGEVANEEIVKGYEYTKGQYVVIPTDEIEKLRTPSDKAIAIKEFIDASELDPTHFDKTYYLVPDGAIGQRPFNVLHRGMLDENKYAVAEVVLGDREQVVLLRPVEQLIAMSTLLYESEVKLPSSFADEVQKVEIEPDELKLMKLLIDQSSAEDFNFAAYKDLYVERLTKLIEAKIEGKEIVTPPAAEEPHVVNLMDALKASVERATQQGKVAKPPKKVAPSRPAAAKRKRKTS